MPLNVYTDFTSKSKLTLINSSQRKVSKHNFFSSTSNEEIIHSECFVDTWIKLKISLQIFYVVYIDKQMVIYKYKLVISPPVKLYAFIHPAKISFILGVYIDHFEEPFSHWKKTVFRLQSDIWMIQWKDTFIKFPFVL